jgi:thiol:disulfide interchange protein
MSYNFLATALIAASVFAFFKAFQTQYPVASDKYGTASSWYTNFEQALQVAQEQKKNIFVKIGAPYCSICKTIDRTILSQKEIADFITTHYIPFVIDNKEENPEHAQLQQTWNIRGVPAFFILNPQGERQHRFGSEIVDWPRAKFIAMLKEF